MPDNPCNCFHCLLKNGRGCSNPKGKACILVQAQVCHNHHEIPRLIKFQLQVGIRKIHFCEFKATIKSSKEFFWSWQRILINVELRVNCHTEVSTNSCSFWRFSQFECSTFCRTPLWTSLVYPFQQLASGKMVMAWVWRIEADHFWVWGGLCVSCNVQDLFGKLWCTFS